MTRLCLLFVLVLRRSKGRMILDEERKIDEDDLPPFFLIPPLCGSRLRAWSRMLCSGALSIHPGESVWVNAALISTQPRCWLECARLWDDEEDSPNCKSRTDEGLDAISTLSEGVLSAFSQSMGPIIDALSELGYDPLRLHAAPYDFRLSPQKLEARDGYFSKLKAKFEIECMLNKHNQRAIVLAHSMGCKIFNYFLKWLEIELKSKKEAKRWIQKHIALYLMNACPFLGAPDIATSLIVGEQNGMPISIKLIHEVLASSAGGILQLAGIPESYLFDQQPKNKTTHKSFFDDTNSFPWLRLQEEDRVNNKNTSHYTYYGQTPCHGEFSTYNFFLKLANETNDSHSKETAALMHKLCFDPTIGEIFRHGLNRPPIDKVHVSYGVGLMTRISTTFGLLPGNSSQTLPYFYDSMSKNFSKYERMTKTFTVRGYVDESGLDSRTLTDHNKHIIYEKLPGKSGDDTVPYSSLSAAHNWFHQDMDEVSVLSVPLRKKFLREEVLTNQIYNASTRSAISTDLNLSDYEQQCTSPERDDRTCPQRESRLTIFEQISKKEQNKQKVTTIWEIESASHRSSANHPVYLHHLQRLVLNHILETKNQTSISKAQDFFQANDFLPTDDSECFWSFAKAACAHPSICEYRYAVGDLSLSQSCRLKRTLTSVISSSSDTASIEEEVTFSPSSSPSSVEEIVHE
uniref:Phospholipid:diacylglycerol acyltransferase n=1 Tax=Aureoumbra lagunensis TaxID=44058 RepID=A0A7S3NPC1_9STRA|mmetsp:Transcript_14717/g.22169  ORF Transcript_14717/g.22169 Transcript_14717/m.22169 type:complete len:688 (+) Transcript_14717:45-2108(+)